MDIKVTKQPDGSYIAIDADTYDVDCDENGFFATSPVGWGETPEEAIAELKADIEDRANA